VRIHYLQHVPFEIEILSTQNSFLDINNIMCKVVSATIENFKNEHL